MMYDWNQLKAVPSTLNQFDSNVSMVIVGVKSGIEVQEFEKSEFVFVDITDYCICVMN